ncbi:MAG: acetyl-CoA C-acyltransferase [Bacteroidetes bacterium]|nr:acetyl-CoA C-acyltransferase [Bacteroidota bacterium]MDA0942891.1 acetyl-CoA C-acyltransferase [Bacteroidota bacterium]
MANREVYIVGAKRTPLGSFNGSLSSVPAPKLGAVAIQAALEQAGIDPNSVQEVYMGSVLQAGLGQAPARQAAKFAGIGDHVPATTVNKVCASGMKAVSLAAQGILLGHTDIAVAGGMENMSLVPHYLPQSRTGTKYGEIRMQDGLQLDGLTDVYNQVAMGNCADTCASEYGFTREDQDAYAINSYKRSAQAWAEGKFQAEIAPVTIKTRKGEVLFAEDEEYKNVIFDKIPGLRPAFTKEGTVTAANASTMNDGAAALVLVSGEKLAELGLTPLAKLNGFADAEQAPEWFTTTPSKAMPLAAERAGISLEKIDYFEFNEAFSVVALANNKILGLDAEKVNVNGGAVSLGHPLGASGARILVTLIQVLKQNQGQYGGAAICNGGGGASAMVIENCV